MLVRTIERCRLIGPTPEGLVTLELQDGARLHRDRLESKEVQGLLREQLHKLLGDRVQLSVRASGGEVSSSDSSADDPASRKSRELGPAVRKVVEKFDGQILDLDDQNPS